MEIWTFNDFNAYRPLVYGIKTAVLEDNFKVPTFGRTNNQ